MKNKKLSFLLSTILAIGVLTGCGTGSDNHNGSPETPKTEESKQDKVTAKFHTSIETKEENDTVIVNYKVKNTSGTSLKLTFNSGLQADYIIYDSEGNKVKQYSDEAMSTQAIQEVELKDQQELENGFTISELYNGIYKIEVFLTAEEEQAKVVTDLIIEKSIYTKGSGIYTGQMDPHTIEMDVNGEATAFQLTDQAISQIPSLKEGETFDFIYTENEIQKTIEKFLLE